MGEGNLLPVNSQTIRQLRQLLGCWRNLSIEQSEREMRIPPNARLILMTYGNGSLTVKLKQILSSISLSTASKRWRSCSTVYSGRRSVSNAHVDNERRSHRGVHVDFSAHRLRLRCKLGEPNGIRDHEDVPRLLQRVVHLR